MIKYAGKPKKSKRPRARKDDASQNEPGHGQSSESSALPPAHTTGFTPVNQYQSHERTHATGIHSRKRSRNELSPPRSHHYQNSESSTATGFPTPYGPSGSNDGKLIDNQLAYSSATFGGGRTNAGPPFQSPDYPSGAPIPYSYYQPETHSDYHPEPHDYHPEQSGRGAKRRSTGPPGTSGYPSITPRPKGPRDPGGRNDIYF